MVFPREFLIKQPGRGIAREDLMKFTFYPMIVNFSKEVHEVIPTIFSIGWIFTGRISWMYNPAPCGEELPERIAGRVCG